MATLIFEIGKPINPDDATATDNNVQPNEDLIYPIADVLAVGEIGQLGNVDLTGNSPALANNHFLVYNGTNWVHEQPSDAIISLGVTATATELNKLDGATVSTTEINYLDIVTLGTSQASKAITVDANGDLIVPDSDKFQFGDGLDMTLYHDGTNSYLTNQTGALKIATETSGIAVQIGHSTSEVTIGDNLVVTGNLTVNGQTTTVNSTVTTIDDPIITLGGDTAPGSDDNKDRGIEFRYHNGSAAKVGFFGYDDSTSKFTFIPDATNNSEVFSGSAGNVAFGAGEFSGDLTVDTSVLKVDSSNNRVGIGTASPAKVLHVVDTTGDAEIARFEGGDGNIGINGGAKITFSRNAINYLTCTDVAGSLRFETGGAGNNRLTIDSSGDSIFSGHVTLDNAKTLRLSETDANGSHYIALKAPDSVTANTILTLPDGAGTNGQALTTNGSGTLSWTTISASLSSASITGQTAETSIADDDLILISDTSASGALRKMTKANFVSGLGGGGLSNVVEDTTPQLGGNLDLNGNAITGHFLPSAAGTYNLGSSLAEWGNLYLKDSSRIYFGDNQDVYLEHDHNRGLRLKMGTQAQSDPQFWIESSDDGNTGPGLYLWHNTSSLATNDTVGKINFTKIGDSWSTIKTVITDAAKESAEIVMSTRISSDVSTSEVVGLKIFAKNNTDTKPTVRISDSFNLPAGDGTNGQVLQTDGSGQVSWATVSSGSSTLSSLSDTSISGPSSGQILVYDGSNSFDNVSISGDATLSSAGALTIAANAVEGSMLNNNVISGQAEMTGDVEDTDELLISDAGTVKRADFSVVRDAVFADVSGDATIAAGGSLTIGASSVEGSMLHDNVISQKTELTTGLVSTDELLVSDAGTLKRMDVSVLQSYLQSNLTFTTALTQENVEDFVGGMVSGNTETFVTVTYDDSDGTLDFVVPVYDEDDMNSNSATHLATQQSIKAYVDAQVAGGGLNIDGYNALGGTGLHQTEDHFVFSDNGTEKKITFSNLQDAIFADVSGDATIAAGGALTIAASSVENSMLAGSIANAKLANSSVTIGSTSTALGATSTSLAGLQSVAVDNITIDGNTISSTDSNGNILLSPDGTGVVRIDGTSGVDIQSGEISVKNGGSVSNIKLYCEVGNAHYTQLQSAAHGSYSGNVTLTLPTSTGTLVGSGDSGTVTNAMLAGSITASKLNNAIFADLETLGAPASDGQFIVATGAGAFAYESGNTARSSLGLGTGDSPTFTSLTLSGQASSLAMNSQKITGLATPTADGDAATKSYVDSVAAGLDIYDSVKAATTASFTMASTASTGTLVLANGEGGFDSAADTFTVDGVSLSQNDRVLIKDGVNSNSAGVHNKWNGIYTVGALSGATLTLTRATDMDASSEFNSGAFFFVEQGTINADGGFVLTNDSAVTVGTTAIVFTQFSGAGQVTAGDGLAKSGNSLSVNVDDSSIEINSDSLRVKAAGITNAMLADDAVGADELAANAVVNASIVDGAIKADKLDIDGSTDIGADLVDADLIVVDDGAAGTNRKSALSRIKKYIYSAMTGDATSSDAGVLTLAADSVEGSMLNDNVISGQTEMTGDVADADELLISDNGTVKRADFSVVRDAVFNDVSGDATIAAGGALTLAAASVEGSMLNASAITGQTAETSIADDDLILISDTSASGALKKMTKANFVSGLGSGNFSSSDITGQTTITAIADNDLVVLADASDSNNLKKISRADFLRSLAPSFTSSNGINIGDFKLSAGQDSTTSQYLKVSMNQNENSNSEPGLLIENSSSDSSGGRIIFSNNHSGVTDNDYLGFLDWAERESSSSQVNWVKLRGAVSNHSSFYGRLDLMVGNGGSTLNGPQVGATLTGSANGINFDIEDHNGGTAGLKLGGTLVTSTAAELNKLDGATVTTTEINLLDGGTAVGSSITIADADGFIINDNGTMKSIPASDLKTYIGAGAADDLTAGDAAVTLTTTSGNITIDAQANDSDIIFAGTDNNSHITMLTLDGSDAGTAVFNNNVKLQSDASVLYFGAGHDVNLTHVHDAGLTLNSTRYLSFNDTGTKIWSSEDGQLDLASDGTMVDSVLVNAASGGIKLNAGLDGNAAAIHLDSASGVTIAGGDNNDSVYVENSPLELEQISAPSTTTNKLYNVGGTLTWNGSAVTTGGGGGSATIPKVLTGGTAGNLSLAFESSGNNGDNEKVYLINNSSNARTATLPTYSGNGGKKFQVKVLGTGNVTIAVQSGEVLEGTTNGTYVLSTQYESVTLIANDSGSLNGWYII